MFAKVFLIAFIIFLYTGCDYNYYPNLEKQKGAKRVEQISYPKSYKINTYLADKNKNLFKYQIIVEDTNKDPQYELMYLVGLKEAKIRCQNLNKNYNQINKKFTHPEKNINGKWSILFECTSSEG